MKSFYLFSAVLCTVPVTTGLQSALEKAVGNVPAQSIATSARPALTHTNTHSILSSKLHAQAPSLDIAPVQHYVVHSHPQLELGSGNTAPLSHQVEINHPLHRVLPPRPSLIRHTASAQKPFTSINQVFYHPATRKSPVEARQELPGQLKRRIDDFLSLPPPSVEFILSGHKKKVGSDPATMKAAETLVEMSRNSHSATRLGLKVDDNLVKPGPAQVHPQSVVPFTDLDRPTKKGTSAVFRNLPSRYPAWVETPAQELLFDIKRKMGADLSKKVVIDDIKRQAHKIDIGLRDRITGELIRRTRLPNPVMEVTEKLYFARGRRLDSEKKIFGRFLSPGENKSVKEIFEKEFTEKAGAELHLIITEREQLLERLAKRRVSFEETIELSKKVLDEEIAETRYVLANPKFKAFSRAI